MRRSLVGVMLVALLAPHAQADDREKWQVLSAGSLMLAVGGGYILYRGKAIVDDAHGQLCADGVVTADCVSSGAPIELLEDRFDRLREQRERGELLGLLGLGVIAGSLGIGTYALYKWATFEPTTDVTIMPTVSKGGGGAQLMMRW